MRAWRSWRAPSWRGWSGDHDPRCAGYVADGSDGGGGSGHDTTAGDRRREGIRQAPQRQYPGNHQSDRRRQHGAALQHHRAGEIPFRRWQGRPHRPRHRQGRGLRGTGERPGSQGPRLVPRDQRPEQAGEQSAAVHAVDQRSADRQEPRRPQQPERHPWFVHRQPRRKLQRLHDADPIDRADLRGGGLPHLCGPDHQQLLLRSGDRHRPGLLCTSAWSCRRPRARPPARSAASLLSTPTRTISATKAHASSRTSPATRSSRSRAIRAATSASSTPRSRRIRTAWAKTRATAATTSG